MTIENDKLNQSEKILLAAFKCLSSRGYANVSMRDIADEAGVVLSQLTYYFKNKEGLFKEVVKMMTNKYLQEIEESLKREKTPKGRILSLTKYFKKLLNHNPELFKLLYDFTGLALWSPAFSKLLRELFKELSNMIEKYIINNLQIKEIKGYSPKALSKLILGAVLGTAIQEILDNGDNPGETLNAVGILFE
ncbi:transcriptional regulator, TetR family [Anaerobranca californiensis DSM 14826]|jgi:AcrR family transcriptional regulator|uniref:Transcriptional regulator, TetR family n=1 Tax=Anaerobranca californiensis DSM 14826 TaxID=1120989 RepID=A0A1M6L9Y6_9FIRM|nr:TetR/AcrR family transcriptional regulator [Anaerobranca californiensis]SHJ67982.1 transcriptional regulator, TetR family [Anaerobranca californiensis DSM 14826]